MCQKWLGVNVEDGMISREIPALESKEMRLAAARESVTGSPTDFGLERKGMLYDT
jgi:hypothetical protein